MLAALGRIGPLVEAFDDAGGDLVDVVGQRHDVEGRDADIVGEGAGDVDADAAGLGIEVEAAGAGGAAVHADDMALAGDALADRQSVDLGADLGDLEYAVEIGLPNPTEAAISVTEPLVKAEILTHRGGRSATILMKRQGPSAWLRDEDGRRQSYEGMLLPSETALAGFQDAARYTELDLVRRALLDWRFYHTFRTDKASAIRMPALAVTTPTLSSDGSDLAACLATVMNIRGEAPAIEAAVRDAFPGADLTVTVDGGHIHLALKLPDMQRPLAVHELSDGTLAYLCLVAALLSYRLPGFVALNEPESSLHAELIRPLARLIASASERTQIWVVTHSSALAEALETEQAQARDMVATVEHPTAGLLRLLGAPFKFSGTPTVVRRPPPLLGEHTDEVLANGFGAAKTPESGAA